MTYVFDKEGREMPVRPISRAVMYGLVAGVTVLVAGLIITGVCEYRLSSARNKALMALAGQQAKTAERVRVLERGQIRAMQTAVADSTVGVIFVDPKRMLELWPSFYPRVPQSPSRSDTPRVGSVQWKTVFGPDTTRAEDSP